MTRTRAKLLLTATVVCTWLVVSAAFGEAGAFVAFGIFAFVAVAFVWAKELDRLAGWLWDIDD
jgi:hypothetical protein